MSCALTESNKIFVDTAVTLSSVINKWTIKQLNLCFAFAFNFEISIRMNAGGVSFQNKKSKSSVYAKQIKM